MVFELTLSFLLIDCSAQFLTATTMELQHAGWLGEREGGPLAPLFMFLLPPGPALCNLGLVRSAVLPEVLTLVLGPSFDLLLFYFRGLFPSLSFSHRHFGLL